MVAAYNALSQETALFTNAAPFKFAAQLNAINNSLTNFTNNLTNLTNILTANTLRMNDAERLRAIDHIYSDTQSKLMFLRGFDNQVALLALERQKEQNDTQMLKQLY